MLLNPKFTIDNLRTEARKNNPEIELRAFSDRRAAEAWLKG
jgi:hypothetical protein